MKCKGQNNVDKRHLEPMEDTKKEPYENKKLHPKCKNVKTQANLKTFKKNPSYSTSEGGLDRCKNTTMIVGPTHHPYVPCLFL
jgi:hypothetical protein